MALIRMNPALPPCGRPEVLAAEAIVEACLWHVLDVLGREDAATALVAAAIDCRSQPEILRRVWALATDVAGALTGGAGLAVAPVGSGRLGAHDRGGRVGRRFSEVAAAVRAAVEAAADIPVSLPARVGPAAREGLKGVHRARALWLSAHPRWAEALDRLQAFADGIGDLDEAADALRRALRRDAEVEPELAESADATA